ncbi:menaquinone biosynthetic enzyme MqnA/MqnD family protein [Pedobacter sp. SL55]|uniref:menaquinone biosynthetic enzyme MqnA/MqnD family protein n=1 Tax=Pedobacter sp. SL55 TaxID=2995161 RepID=UPI00226D8876|nr:menaquinone biosynthesis protein [Pedobacter sp. SL55]WAC39748.1 menaquinone biosynthesis protein [Pedobacter sp. SL55]
MEKIKISAVSYTNTKPFIYGIQNSTILEKIDLSLDIPADCAKKLIENQVDIGLIPVAAIPFVPNAQIISSFCIGSVGAVNSVFIFSDVPIQEIKTVKLDPQSRTSNNLAKVLLKNHFNVEVTFTTDQNATTDAIVLIGDRTFGRKTDFNYAYDLGEEWMKFTGLPFMFAAWVANKPISEEFLKEFDIALAKGISNIPTVINQLPAIKGIDIADYLLHKLNFELNEDKLKAKDLFLSLIAQL